MSTPRFDLIANALASQGAYPRAARAIVNLAGWEAARAEIAGWPGYAPTPLVSLSGLARGLGLDRVWYKDEGGRFGLGSFKALGGAYAVYRLLADEIERRTYARPSAAALLAGAHRELASKLTVTTATDGNHGRSVAWGAKLFGCRSVIYIHATVSEGRRAAIAAFGAEVVRIAGNYDESVRQAAADAAAKGWHVVSDTSYGDYRQVPCDVMHGYTVLAGETADQLDADRPTHVFLQGGVGGLAAAVAGHLWERWGERPRIVAVEPFRADCLYQSAKAGRPTPSTGDLETVMAGLAAGEVSLVAWDVLAPAVDHFLVIDDDFAVEAMRRLAQPAGGDTAVVGGEAGVGGLAGLIAVAADPLARSTLGLRADSRVLLIGSEGDTDPATYVRLVGETGDQVRARVA
jgi:diaminopropionate ammonia-lyase